MNVPFNILNDSLNDSFLSEATDNGLFELKGHRSVGGFRLLYIMLCLLKVLQY